MCGYLDELDTALISYRFFFSFAEEKFQSMQHDFKEKYYQHFTDEEENKLIYMDIFQEYVSIIAQVLTLS